MMIQDIRKTENLHILLWLVKDTCWCLTLFIPGLIMIVPTLSLAVYITWKTRKILSELMHNLAICFWIMANSIWMIGEFFYDDGLRHYALAFFITGLAVIIAYYIMALTHSFNKRDINNV